MTEKRPIVHQNPWRKLRQFTDARIGLGRAGISLPTQELLKFQLAHAQAIDAVHCPLDVGQLQADLAAAGVVARPEDVLSLASAAPDRATYLQRPDLGRALSPSSGERLSVHAPAVGEGPDLAIVIVDGLSSRAVQSNAAPMVARLITDLDAEHGEWRLAPLTVVEQGRVAIGDDIGARLRARAVLVLIGERPGLSSPDSLGAYLTWKPCIGRKDADRNCVSNIRPAGLDYANASQRLLYLIRESFRRKLSGVALKDRTEEVVIDSTIESKNFLTRD
ncbi:ethanolamine ammonia-lyase subunit EutC [Marinobacter pelagius]|uniref:ethanolamine ammonia-lyase subunit EutC n=1 Tax=Marinobacter sp. C7 TaxID=2951363 RepID=UPI001EEF7AFB|nr:ethanolamine ammonia-lyase subunit EutC [Marinobacter sp. C7]MCG7201532.1 ethanolamine ammonia-lyase subunit EutC [Marinobacter sp. C7]